MNSDNYNYENPITRIQNQLLEEMVKKEEDQFMCEVRQTIGYNIDKSELVKTLNYDRDQYERGYQDGKSAAKRIGQWIIAWDKFKEKINQLQTYKLFQNDKETYLNKQDIIELILKMEREVNNE